MSVATIEANPRPGTRMTVEAFESLGLSEDSTLVLIGGVVYDETGCETHMTKRNRQHARTELLLGQLLQNWVDQTKFRGKVFSGEVGCVVSEHGLSVGIDVALFENSVLEHVQDGDAYITGPPSLAAEILSPSDQVESIEAKIRAYLRAGVEQVWIISPGLQSVTVHSPNQNPRIYSRNSTIDGGSSLPGLSILVDRLFE